MELKAFADIVSEGIQKVMGEDYSISVVEKFKNKIGIEFVKKSEASLQTHTVHIQDLLGEYNKKDDIETIVQEVISRYNRSLEAASEVYQLDFELEQCRNRVIYRLMSRERNQKLLDGTPYIPFLDMAITFHIVVSLNKRYVQTIRISEKIQKRWGVSVEQLLKMASANTENILPLEITSLDKMVEKYINVEKRPPKHPQDLDMIVITNCIGIYGAAAILYKDLMQSLADELNCDLYVVPSSVHEMIVIPAEDKELYEMLSSLVKEVNTQCVDPDEILADRVFIYMREENRFI